MRKFLWVLIFYFFAQTAYSYEYFDLGKNAYDTGFYGQAKEYLGIAVKNKPKNITYRYYYALTLNQLGELDAAAEQYQMITLSKPNSSEGQKSARALESFKKYFETKSGEYKLPDADDGNYMDYLIIENNDLKRWDKYLLSVYVQPSNSSSIVEQAFKTWEEKSNNLFVFNFTPAKETADITVTFIDKMPLISPESSTITGTTSIKYYDNNINHADIQIQDKDNKTKESFSPDTIYATALHTIGHALGLNTHSESTKDIMYWDLTDDNKSLSRSDINTLRMLYGISTENLEAIHQNPSIFSIKLNSSKDYAEAHPEIPIAWSNLASAYVAVNDYPKAIESIEKAIELTPNDPVLYTQLAEYYNKTNRADLGIENYKKAYDLQPDNKVYLFNWAKACYKNKRDYEAREAVDSYLMGSGFLANDEISRLLRRMYKQDKTKERDKILRDRAEKQRKIEEAEQLDQQMFVD